MLSPTRMSARSRTSDLGTPRRPQSQIGRHRLGTCRRDTDRLECRELLGWDKQRDSAGPTGVPLDEPAVVQGHDHPMNGGRRDAEEIQEVALSRRSAMQSRVGVDERQVLALERGESDRHVPSDAEGPAMLYDTASRCRL